MSPDDLQLRRETYRSFVVLGRAPSAVEMADSLDVGTANVVAGWRRLHAEHALVLDPATDEILMANPFSAVPTVHRVEAGGRQWFANCAWDAFGVFAALGTDGRIASTCPDCGLEIQVAVRAGRPDDESLVFHCLVPALQWWDDIVFT